jgi:hypothetical protein
MNQQEINRLSVGDDRTLPAIYPKKFWTDTKDNPMDPLNPIKIDMVEWVKRGAPGTGVVNKISHLRKDPSYWAVVGPYYEAWLKGNEEPTEGTPFSAWPGIKPHEAEKLRFMMIRTVQDLAAMTEADFERSGIMGIRTLRDKAQAFLRAGEQTKAAAELTAASQRITELESSLKDALSAIGDMQRRLPPEERMEKLPPVVEERKGPGRPRKTEE